MMRILSVRRSFEADHSSSSYEFFAFNRLIAEQREAVQSLIGESPRRHLRFHYWGDWQDIPSDWPDKLLTLGYDVLVSESYDWWSVHLSLPHDPAFLERLQPYGQPPCAPVGAPRFLAANEQDGRTGRHASPGVLGG